MQLTVAVSIWAIPVFVVLSIAEWIDGNRDSDKTYQQMSARDVAGNWTTYLLNTLVKTFWRYLMPFSTIVLASALTPLRLSADHWWVWVACLAVSDFCYYWAHRADHRVRLLWAAHSVHHSSTYFNMSTNLRLPWLHPVSYTIRSLAWLPAALLGFPAWMIFLCDTVILAFQIPCHTERIGKLWRPYEFVFNTPLHHRVHHGSNRPYIDKNYGGLFIIWDRLFGSYAEESEPVRYGLIHNINTDNPLRYNYLETAAMLREVTHARTGRERLGYLVVPPGWNDKGPSEERLEILYTA